MFPPSVWCCVFVLLLLLYATHALLSMDFL
nr:MAG TPA: hypothetical protein [Caudoviricetes sp.]